MKGTRLSNDSIELCKPKWTPTKMRYPAFVSEKLDGVPVRIRRMGGGHILAFSRQNEVVTSIPHIIEQVRQADFLREGGCIVGELYIKGMKFKDISGLVRTKVPNADTEKLVLNLFDFDCDNMSDIPWAERRGRMIRLLDGVLCPNIRMIPGIRVTDGKRAEEVFEAIIKLNPDAEGAVCVWTGKQFEPGKRQWTSQKMLKTPTLDVLVTGFEEAVEGDTGLPKGMVGRVLIELQTRKAGREIKVSSTAVGPGTLTHDGRTLLWRQFVNGEFTPAIAQVAYKTDDSYNGLREGRFQHWRPDKYEADIRDI